MLATGFSLGKNGMQLNELVSLRSDLMSRKMRVVAIEGGHARCIWHSVSGKICGETYPIASLISEPEPMPVPWEQRRAG